MNIGNELQRFISKCINSHEDETVYFSSVTELDIIIKNLYNEKNFFSLANILESISILDRNTYVLQSDEQYMLHHIILSSSFLSCILYHKVGSVEYSSFLAQSNYSYLKQYLDNLENRNLLSRDIVKAIYLEMLGDFCLFFNKGLSEDNYNKAITIYKCIDGISQYGEFSDWYWSSTKNRFIKLFEACYGIKIDMPELGHDRIDYKLALFNQIL